MRYNVYKTLGTTVIYSPPQTAAYENIDELLVIASLPMDTADLYRPNF